ncbi:MAG: class I SAM-dependent methyltransferase, partial [Ktedonobacteraceae bacterium]|nr:class I SAM-dependent methyltransferase [Ktedonobacteraceae bacterium]
VGRGNVVALLQDIYHLPAHLYQRYDLVHARLLAPSVPPRRWPRLLHEMVWACKPGGWVVWSEPELPVCLPVCLPKTPAWNQWLTWCEQSLLVLGGSPAIAPQMETLFRQAGRWRYVLHSQCFVPLSLAAYTPTPLRTDQLARLRGLFRALCPTLLAAEVATPKALDAGIEQVLEELRTRHVQSQWRWHTISGRKA